MNNDPTLSAAIGETVLLTLAGGEPSDFMQSFPPVQFAMEVRRLFEAAERNVVAAHYRDKALLRNDYGDYVERSKAVRETLALMKELVRSINKQSRDYLPEFAGPPSDINGSKP